MTKLAMPPLPTTEKELRAEFDRVGEIAEQHPLKCLCDMCRRFADVGEALRQFEPERRPLA